VRQHNFIPFGLNVSNGIFVTCPYTLILFLRVTESNVSLLDLNMSQQCFRRSYVTLCHLISGHRRLEGPSRLPHQGSRSPRTEAVLFGLRLCIFGKACF